MGQPARGSTKGPARISARDLAGGLAKGPGPVRGPIRVSNRVLPMRRFKGLGRPMELARGPARISDRGLARGPAKSPTRRPTRGSVRGPAKGPAKGPARGPARGPTRVVRSHKLEKMVARNTPEGNTQPVHHQPHLLGLLRI